MWRWWEGTFLAHLILGYFIHAALFTCFLHFLLCRPSPSHTNACNSFFSLNYPLLLRTTAAHLWVQAQCHGKDLVRESRPLAVVLAWCSPHPHAQCPPLPTSHHLTATPGLLAEQSATAACTKDHLQLWPGMG